MKGGSRSLPAETRTTFASMVCESPPLAGSTVSFTTSPSLAAPVTCAAANVGNLPDAALLALHQSACRGMLGRDISPLIANAFFTSALFLKTLSFGGATNTHPCAHAGFCPQQHCQIKQELFRGYEQGFKGF